MKSVSKKVSVFLFGLAVAFMFVSTSAFAYPIVVSGNDNIDSVKSQTGDETLTLLAKYGWNEINRVWSFDDGTSDVFTIINEIFKDDTEPISGTWSTSPATYVWYVSIKAENDYALYKIDPAATLGSWTTELLYFTNSSDKKIPYGVSHISFWRSETAVPIPAAAWLLGSGLVGLLGIRMRRKQR